MSDPVRLEIARSPAQENTVTLLREMLADAERGDLLSVVAVVTRPGGKWSALTAGVISGMEMAGMIGCAWLDMQTAMRKGG
jgi:hypothetical protein